MANRALIGWDVTIHGGKEVITRNELGEKLQASCKAWVFQGEPNAEEAKYDQHWQIRLKLRKKLNMVGAKELTQIGGHWAPTSTDVHRHKNFNYVMKVPRTEGPYKDDTWVTPNPITRQLRTYYGHPPYSWQRALEKRLSREDDRSIVWVRNMKGCAGKTVFMEDMEQKIEALRIPPLRQVERFMGFAFSFPSAKVYMQDLPRAMKEHEMGEWYEGIETLKGGWMYDWRNKGRRRWFDRPQILIMANMDPRLDMLTKDMWEIYEIGEDKKLYRVGRDEVTAEETLEWYWPFSGNDSEGED